MNPILPEMGMIRLEQHGVYYGDKFLVRARFRYPEVEYGRELCEDPPADPVAGPDG